jgi:hypothetical protein
MSKMADLEIEILGMIEEGYRPVTIASMLGVPLTWVYEAAENAEEESSTEVYSPFETINS